MTETSLRVQVREALGKGAARRLRRSGLVPGVVYGTGPQAIHVAVPERELFRTLQIAGTHSLVDLHIAGGGNGGRHKVLIKEVQQDPMRDEFVHVDFHAVALDQEIQTTVPVALEGEDARADDGIVQLVLREIQISCLPTDIPEAITVDVSGLAVGDVVTVGQLTPPPGVAILTDPEETVVTVSVPRLAEEEPAGEEAGEADEGGGGEE